MLGRKTKGEKKIGMKEKNHDKIRVKNIAMGN